MARYAGAPEFPLAGLRAHWGLASPRRPPSPPPLPAPSCCHPLHLRLSLQRAGENTVVSCSLWCCGNLSVHCRYHTIPYVLLHIGSASVALQTWLWLACNEWGRRCMCHGSVLPWPGLTLRSCESLWHDGLKPPSLPHKNCQVPLCACPHPHHLIDLCTASFLLCQLFCCSPLWPCSSSAAVPSTACQTESAESTSGELWCAVAGHYKFFQDLECVFWEDKWWFRQ